MSNMITFGILCEDKAHRNFVVKYLNHSFSNLFEESLQFSWNIKAENADEVESTLVDATRLGFTRYNLDVLFVGRDADSNEQKHIDVLKKKLESLCKSHPRVILMVPVQCIEHWLLYLKWRREHPTLTKNESLEHVRRSEAKNRIYGGKLKVAKQLEIADDILTDLDISWLESRSDSFKHFHNQVVQFLQVYSKTE